MANMIGISPDRPEYFSMSNGLTDVFLNVLVLSGSELARTDSEKQLIVWLAEKDQSRVGMGTVGFDLLDMPWSQNSFAADRDFMLQVVAGAKERLNWERLDYHPREDLLFSCLDRFGAFLTQLEAAQIQSRHLEEWLSDAEASDPVLCGFPMCPRHHILLTVFGCHICNN